VPAEGDVENADIGGARKHGSALSKPQASRKTPDAAVDPLAQRDPRERATAGAARAFEVAGNADAFARDLFVEDCESGHRVQEVAPGTTHGA
jgi:hypothetical protein